MRTLTPEEQHEFMTLHLEHRLTAILAFVVRLSDVSIWQGNGDLFRSAIEGASTILRVMIEFLGVRSDRCDGEIRLVRYKSQRDDVTIGSFGRPRLTPEMFGDDQRLIAVVHEGIKKGTVHLTWESGHEYKSDEHFTHAVAVVLDKLYHHLYEPLGYDFHLHPDLERRYRFHPASGSCHSTDQQAQQDAP
jgi:hypothetical protein